MPRLLVGGDGVRLVAALPNRGCGQLAQGLTVRARAAHEKSGEEEIGRGTRLEYEVMGTSL